MSNTFVYLTVDHPQNSALLEAISDMGHICHHVYRGHNFQVYRIENFTKEECSYLSLIIPNVHFHLEDVAPVYLSIAKEIEGDDDGA